MNGSIVPRFSLFSFIYIKIYIYSIYIDFHIFLKQNKENLGTIEPFILFPNESDMTYSQVW